MADMAFEVLGLLMLDEDFFVLKFSVAIPVRGLVKEKTLKIETRRRRPLQIKRIPTPWLRLLLLLTAHCVVFVLLKFDL